MKLVFAAVVAMALPTLAAAGSPEEKGEGLTTAESAAGPHDVIFDIVGSSVYPISEIEPMQGRTTAEDAQRQRR